MLKYVKLPEGNYIGYPRIGYISYIVKSTSFTVSSCCDELQSAQASTSWPGPMAQLNEGHQMFVVTNDYMSYPLVMYVQ
jgi:hypothetical protein